MKITAEERRTGLYDAIFYQYRRLGFNVEDYLPLWYMQQMSIKDLRVYLKKLKLIDKPLDK